MSNYNDTIANDVEQGPVVDQLVTNKTINDKVNEVQQAYKSIVIDELQSIYNTFETLMANISEAENKLNILRNEAKSLSAGYKHIRELGIKLGFITPTDPNEKNQINS